MTNKNKFYSSISKYYSEIFPYKPMQLQFIKSRAGELAGKRILDIGCAAGELASHLALTGAQVTGIDLNEDLLEQAKIGSSGFQSADLVFQKGNMLDLKNDFQPEYFDVVLCFGNTLVHLENMQQVQEMLQSVYTILKTGGHFLLQILNYDYIIDERISELPIIETKNVKFIRKYKLEKNNPIIYFQTELQLKNAGEIISNETQLLALKSKELDNFLYQTGFGNIQFYSGFKGENFGGKHLPLVVSCLK